MAAKGFVIAKRYSRALWLSAESIVEAKKWLQELSVLSKTVVSSDHLLQFLDGNMATQVQTAALLKEAFEKMGVSPRVQNFIYKVTEAGRVSVLSEIAEAFENKILEEENISRVEVETAIALSDKQKKDIQGAVERLTQKQVLLNEKVNPDLVAGVIVRVGGRSLDASFKATLEKMERNLVSQTL